MAYSSNDRDERRREDEGHYETPPRKLTMRSVACRKCDGERSAKEREIPPELGCVSGVVLILSN